MGKFVYLERKRECLPRIDLVNVGIGCRNESYEYLIRDGYKLPRNRFVIAYDDKSS